MPAEAPRPRKGALRGRRRPADPLPQQQPVTDEEPAEKKPSRLRLILLRTAVAVLLVIALVFAYLFLLLGEPDEETKYVDLPDEALITMPMGALEIPGEANLQNARQHLWPARHGALRRSLPLSAPACTTPPSAAATPAA